MFTRAMSNLDFDGCVSDVGVGPITVMCVAVSWRGLEALFGQYSADYGRGDSDYLSGC